MVGIQCRHTALLLFLDEKSQCLLPVAVNTCMHAMHILLPWPTSPYSTKTEAHPWTPNQLHSKSSSTLIAPTEVLQGSIKRKAVQPYCGQNAPSLHHISLPFILIDWPAKREFLQSGQQSIFGTSCVRFRLSHCLSKQQASQACQKHVASQVCREPVSSCSEHHWGTMCTSERLFLYYCAVVTQCKPQLATPKSNEPQGSCKNIAACLRPSK